MSEKIHPAEISEEKPDVTMLEHSLSHHDEEAHQKPKYAANSQLDEAAQILANAGTVEYTHEEGRRVLRKIDLYVCLPMCLTYFIQQVRLYSVYSVLCFGIWWNDRD